MTDKVRRQNETQKTGDNENEKTKKTAKTTQEGKAEKIRLNKTRQR